ncbi:cupredoxin domain-containing protein [Nocardioides panacis]|uniref:Cupredoxin domain-containing protein n=1 Tax=Nocardioides panacis TaxID=2849501 RepID=A0A975SZI1_9ACTN|nr:iron uptake system protein EfeO [Nocardioides panacis]QWZ08265.1 cupredoxin domain-containing protein [Nocardioides panacis]
MKNRRLAAALVAGVSLPALAACTDNSSSSSDATDGRTIAVTSSSDACDLSSDTAPSGRLVFTIKNTGQEVTEFYLYAADGKRIVAEVENIGPGLSRTLVVNADAATYVPACKPGMKGTGIRSELTVTESGGSGKASAAVQEQVDQANAAYREYVEDESGQLLAGTRRFVAAYTSGDDARARTLYPTVRVHWERIEPVAESFGDLDPKMDAREADLEAGQKWTGWHRIEKDLWPPSDQPYTALTKAERATYADQLLADTETLHGRIGKLTFTVDQIGNGAKSLLDEVATGKVTGEEEIWSHTDLYDFQANIDGARVAFEGLRPVLKQKDPALESEIADRFTALESMLAQYRVGADGFVSYEKLDTTQVKQLSDAVNALSEPLSKLTAAVTL